MKNEYHKNLIDLLLACGRTGMPVREIARHVYNEHYGLFAQDVVFERVYKQIRNYLWSQSHQKHSPFLRLGRGFYAMKQDMAVQLDFVSELYQAEEKEESPVPQTEDESRQLSLF